MLVELKMDCLQYTFYHIRMIKQLNHPSYFLTYWQVSVAMVTSHTDQAISLPLWSSFSHFPHVL